MAAVPNRLASSTSPYLLQHADNSVDWWEWGPEAFAEARRRDVPVLVSVGYAACHWCHVMAHESFEDEEVGRQLAAGFVAVKVDREERPDVDAALMRATTALTGQGGWPMTVLCTPQGEPFHAGTYYPPRPHPRMPSFRQLLDAVTQAWTERREEVLGQSAQITQALAERAAAGVGPPGGAPPTAPALAGAVRALLAEEDTVHGGLGGAPKFPPSAVCLWLLRHAATDAPTAGDALGLAGRTLTAMARSGTYDQVAGGFARYAVDAAWVVPHFEKMLYDNAQLARAYLHWWRLTGEPTGARVAAETCDWLVAALRTPEGGFASSLDADTLVPRSQAEGEAGSRSVEGATYVWTPLQLAEVLGPADGAWAAELLGVTAEGTFEHGTSTAQLRRDVWADDGEVGRWVDVRARLRAARDRRPQPARDDKVVTAWNGLAAAALAEAGVLLERPDLLAAAVRCADLLLAVHVDDDGRWRRTSRDGRAGPSRAVLEDLGDLAEGLVALHAATGDAAWAETAEALCEEVLAEHLREGGFCDVPASSDDAVLARLGTGSDPTDGAAPSGTSAAAGALLAVSALTGSDRMRAAAETALVPAGALVGAAPRFAGWALAVAEAALDGPREVAVLGSGAADDPEGRADADALHRTALAGTAPGLVVSRGRPGQEQPPLLAHRGLVEGRAAAYVCRGQVCEAPTTDVDALAAAVGARPDVAAGVRA
ncbi:thioredoxin domain-containing protein [Pseudokineococcus sp. 1T1Z-3]|uniref:thioredoxin domain-containing protein n=1 Tax=Pseudokineococcus sp. 1T1Z-3 TaxID=3132745 RepID=UPI00309C99C0